MLCHRDDEELVVAIFAHQIKSEYYGGNIYVSIEGIKLEHFNTSYQEHHNQYCVVENTMLRFTILCHITPNNMQLQ